MVEKGVYILTSSVAGIVEREKIIDGSAIREGDKAVKNLFGYPHIRGMAHITGGGIEGNLSRIIPNGLSAKIDLSKIKPLQVFSYIRNKGNIGQEEMLSTFNCGVGLIIVVERETEKKTMDAVKPDAEKQRQFELKRQKKKRKAHGQVEIPAFVVFIYT